GTDSKPPGTRPKPTRRSSSSSRPAIAGLPAHLNARQSAARVAVDRPSMRRLWPSWLLRPWLAEIGDGEGATRRLGEEAEEAFVGGGGSGEDRDAVGACVSRAELAAEECSEGGGLEGEDEVGVCGGAALDAESLVAGLEVVGVVAEAKFDAGGGRGGCVWLVSCFLGEGAAF